VPEVPQPWKPQPDRLEVAQRPSSDWPGRRVLRWLRGPDFRVRQQTIGPSNIDIPQRDEPCESGIMSVTTLRACLSLHRPSTDATSSTASMIKQSRCKQKAAQQSNRTQFQCVVSDICQRIPANSTAGRLLEGPPSTQAAPHASEPTKRRENPSDPLPCAYRRVDQVTENRTAPFPRPRRHAASRNGHPVRRPPPGPSLRSVWVG
jgi:hypothetical protein